MKDMDVEWAKEMDKSLSTKLIQEQVDYMDKYISGVKFHTKRKKNGATDYMYVKKSRRGDVDFLLKSVTPKDSPGSILCAKKKEEEDSFKPFNFTLTPDSVSSGREEVPTKRKKSEDEEISEEENLEEEFEEIFTKRIPAKEPRIPKSVVTVTPYKSSTSSSKKLVCPSCFAYECHAHKFGQFCSLVTMTEREPYINHNDSRILFNFKRAYNIARQWDSVVTSPNKKARYISPDEMEEDLPDCLGRFYDLWIRKLKVPLRKSNDKDV